MPGGNRMRITFATRCLVFVCITACSSLAAAAAAGPNDLADAAMRKDISAVRTLLQAKTDVNAVQRDGASALHWAARWDDLAMADLLIKAGANVSAVNRFGVTPLALACINGSASMIDRLLQAGADPNRPLSEVGENASNGSRPNRQPGRRKGTAAPRSGR
jgi:ankyrin repeat protein